MVIKCPKCNHFVSDTAEVCPNCGIQLKNGVSKGNSNDFSEIQSFILDNVDELDDYKNSIYVDNGICFCFNEDEIQIFIEEFLRQTTDEQFYATRDAYLKFKQSSYYQDFAIKDEVCDDSHILLDGTVTTVSSPSSYVAKMLMEVFGITSTSHIQTSDDIFPECNNQEEISDDNHEGITYDGDDEDSANIFLNILSFLLPIVGIILYFIKKSNYPNAAKSYITWAAAGFVVALLINVIS